MRLPEHLCDGLRHLIALDSFLTMEAAKAVIHGNFMNGN